MRVQLIVSEAQQSMIDTLREQIGAATIKEVFNNALTLLNWAVRQRLEGLEICAINESKNVHKELQLPALDFCTYQLKKDVPENKQELEPTISVQTFKLGKVDLVSEAVQSDAREAATGSAAKSAAAGQGRQAP
jgi:hypothetical protein